MIYKFNTIKDQEPDNDLANRYSQVLKKSCEMWQQYFDEVEAEIKLREQYFNEE